MKIEKKFHHPATYAVVMMSKQVDNVGVTHGGVVHAQLLLVDAARLPRRHHLDGHTLALGRIMPCAERNGAIESR